MLSNQSSKWNLSRSALAALFSASAATAAFAQTTYMGPPQTSVAPGTNQWSLPANWDSGVPNAVDAVAQVLYGTNTEIEVDGNFTVGGLVADMGGAFAVTLPTKPTSFDPTKSLTFSTSSGMPFIDVRGNAGSSIFFYNTLKGTQGFEKRGIGKLTFRFNSANQTYTGDVKVISGVLGINLDGSLGDVNNDIYLGATEVGATQAVLVAEPGSNSGLISLPATRDIFLTGTGAQLTTNTAAVGMVVNGAITDGAGSFGVTVGGSGSVLFNGANNYDGITTVSGGALVAATPSSLPGYNTTGRVSAANASVVVRMGGAGEWLAADLDALKSSGTFIATSALGVDTTNATSAVEWAGLTSGEIYSIAKVGPGTLRLTGANNYTGGRLRMFGGTLELGPAGSLPNNVNAIFLNSGTLDLGGKAQTIGAMDDGSGITAKITNGTLTYSGGALTLGGNNGQTTDFSGLSGLIYATTGTELKVETANNVNATQNTVLLAASGASGGVNTVTATARVIVGGGASAANGPHVALMRLGTSNTFNVGTLSGGTFQLGGFNTSGKVDFQSGLTNPTFKLRASDGTSPVANVVIGENSSGARNCAGTLDLSAGIADIVATNMTIGRHLAASDFVSTTSSVNLGAGTITVTNLIMSEKTNSGGPTLSLGSEINQSGGMFTANSVVFGKAITGASAPGQFAAKPAINLSGGTFATSSIAPWTGVNSATFSEANSVRTLRLSGTGTLRNLNASTDLTVSGIASNDADPLTTGNMVFIRVPSGTPTIYADADRKVTLTDTTLIADSGGATPTFGALRKAGPGGLQINGAITGGVPIKVDEGAVQVSNGTAAFNADVNAKLIVDYSGTSFLPEVKANILSGYNAGAWNGTTGFSSSAAAADAQKRFGLGYGEASDVYGAGPTAVNGLSVDNSAVVVRYTYNGDVNLDGAVDSTDFNASFGNAANYGLTSGAEWKQGDFDYDGKVNTIDFNMLAGNFNATPLPAALPGASLGSVVPEPTTLSALALGLSLMLRRRR